MKLFLICSKHFYYRVPEIKEELERAGHIITLPNSYDDPFKEERIKQKDPEEHIRWKGEMMREQQEKVRRNDAGFVLNFDKNGQKNYIGGCTFLEIYEFWKVGKKIFIYNPIPQGMLEDELIGFNPTIINGDLSRVK